MKWSAVEIGLIIALIGTFSIFFIDRWAVIPIIVGLVIIFLGRIAFKKVK